MRALSLLLLASTISLHAQPLSEDLGASGLWQAWKRAQTNARVLYITAHPDDEDAATLTYLARGVGAEVTLLSITRGESGANLITGDFFDALGKLRELEIEKAAQFYGVKVRHTTFTDFGFSKNVGETWRVWNQQKVLAEVQKICDEVRPQVIIARFHGSARDGHGQHTASGEIAKLLFANPGKWKPSKLYTGNWADTDSWTITPPVDQYDAVLGRTYAEIGMEGYRQHRSQGMGLMPTRTRPRLYTLEGSHVGEAAKEESFFERLGREVQPPLEVQVALRDVGQALRLDDPKPMLPAVERALAVALRLRDHDLELKLAELRGRAQGTWKPASKVETAQAPISVSFATEVGVVPVGRTNYQTAVLLRNLSKGTVIGQLRVTGQPDVAFRLQREGEELRLPFSVPVAAKVADYHFEAIAEIGGAKYSTEVRPITATGLRTTYLRKPAMHLLRVVDVKVASGLKVGYVMGTGDEVPEAIRQLGVPLELLSAEELASGDLSRFTTIMLGIRAYAAREDVKMHNQRLLDFVKKGGTLIVQYNTPEFDHNYGPYPYTMTSRTEEVSEENSPIRILKPEHPIFRSPNAITSADFEGWTEQRGSKFWMTWSPEYTPLIETHDTGKAPQEGGWLEARSGQGLYNYCAYAWYRQLPAGVPGAYRLFANLLSRRP